MKIIKTTANDDETRQTVTVEHEPTPIPAKGEWDRHRELAAWIDEQIGPDADIKFIGVTMTIGRIEYGETQTTVHYECDCDPCQCWGVGACQNQYDPEAI